ncbi:hypothetical protein [Methanoculleus sp.]
MRWSRGDIWFVDLTDARGHEQSIWGKQHSSHPVLLEVRSTQGTMAGKE